MPAALERFLNDVPEPTPPLLKAALAHVQFETIHPFLDGNGRIGPPADRAAARGRRRAARADAVPSLFFKTHRRSTTSC
jgi:hypothetical protein